MALCLSILGFFSMLAWLYVAFARYEEASVLGSPEWIFLFCAPFFVSLCDIFLLFLADGTISHLVFMTAAGVWLIIAAWQALTEINNLVEMIRRRRG